MILLSWLLLTATAGATPEALRASAERSFSRLAAPQPAVPEAPKATPARAVQFSLEPDMADGFRLRGAGVSLSVRPVRPGGAGGQELEAMGSLYGRGITRLRLRADAFGSSQRRSIEGDGFRLLVERVVGFGESRVELELEPGMDSASVTALLALLGLLERAPIAGAPGFPAAAAGERFSIREAGGEQTFIDGPLVQAQAHRRAWGGTTRYELLGNAYGCSLTGLVIERDPAFLGRRGFRARGAGLNLEARDESLGRWRLEYSGAAGDSPQLAALVLILSDHFGER